MHFIDRCHVGGRDIFHAKFDRIHADAFRQHVHMGFNGETGLHAAEPAHCAADRRVGVNTVTSHGKMLDLIDHKNPHDRSG